MRMPSPPRKQKKKVKPATAAIVPDGWFTKEEAAASIDRNTKTVERIARKGEVPTQYIANRGTRSITIYERERFLEYFKEYTETPRPLPPPADALVATARPAASRKPPPMLALVPDSKWRFYSIPEASALTGLSERFLKLAAMMHPELVVKDGRHYKFKPGALDKLSALL